MRLLVRRQPLGILLDGRASERHLAAAGHAACRPCSGRVAARQTGAEEGAKVKLGLEVLGCVEATTPPIATAERAAAESAPAPKLPNTDRRFISVPVFVVTS